MYVHSSCARHLRAPATTAPKLRAHLMCYLQVSQPSILQLHLSPTATGLLANLLRQHSARQQHLHLPAVQPLPCWPTSLVAVAASRSCRMRHQTTTRKEQPLAAHSTAVAGADRNQRQSLGPQMLLQRLVTKLPSAQTRVLRRGLHRRWSASQQCFAPAGDLAPPLCQRLLQIMPLTSRASPRWVRHPRSPCVHFKDLPVRM